MGVAIPPTQSTPAQGAQGQGPIGAVSDNVKGCLGFLVSLLIVGSIAEMVSQWSEKAAYLFVAVVVLGYAASGGNANAVADFFAQLSANHTLPNGGRVR